MNEKVKFLRDWARMCYSFDCADCPLEAENTDTGLSCETFLKLYPEKAVEIIEKWAKDHPKKTYKDDFLEKFPKAALKMSGIPSPCRDMIYGTYSNCHGECEGCWNEPMEE